LASEFGEVIDFANSRRATRLLLGPGLDLSIGRDFRADLTGAFERVSLEGEKVFLERLVQARLLYHLNIRSFLRLISQYRNISRNTELYLDPVDPETRKVFIQFLFSYRLNPQTALFVGYSDNRLGLRDTAFTQADRTFFLKIGYAWRM
jgi:hypothetical protein